MDKKKQSQQAQRCSLTINCWARSLGSLNPPWDGFNGNCPRPLRWTGIQMMQVLEGWFYVAFEAVDGRVNTLQQMVAGRSKH